MCRSQEFLAFLKKIDTEVPDDLDCHVILDNASTYKPPQVERWLDAHPRATRNRGAALTPRYDKPRPYVWTKTADQIIESVANYSNELTTQHNRSDLHLHSRGGRLG